MGRQSEIPGGVTKHGRLARAKQQLRAYRRLLVYGVNVNVDDQPEHISVLSVTTDYFKVIGVTPAMGRDLREGDGSVERAAHGRTQSRLLATAFRCRSSDRWSDNQTQQRELYRHRRDAQGFAFPNSEVAVWTPMRGNLAAAGRGVHSYQAIARLKPGVALQQAQSEMDAIASRLEEEYPGTNKDVGIRLVSLQKELVEDEQPRLLLLFGSN